MSKRRKRATTRGIRRVDEFANFITGIIRVSAQIQDDVFRTVRITTPLPRFKTVGLKATIMELLWVDFVNPTMVVNFDVQKNSLLRVQLTTGTPTAGVLEFRDPRVIAEVVVSKMFIKDVNGNTFWSLPNQPWKVDLQTQDGFGYLLASDEFNFQFAMAGRNVDLGMQVEFKLWYRFIDVSLAEYVGIVQSSQQS